MKYIQIEGGRPLNGELAVQGSKNAVLPIMAAALLTTQPVTLYGCPQIEDVRVMCQLLSYMGVEVMQKDDVIRIQARQIRTTELPAELVNQMRSSIMLMGPLLSRTGKAKMCFPGGCCIGSRPIDLHLSGLRQLGYDIAEENEEVTGVCSEKLKEETRRIHLRFPSVGATENIVMGAVMAPGETVLIGAAKEPEVRELLLVLCRMGARIEGIGTEKLTIWGQRRLFGIQKRIMPDRIVSGTYLLAAAVTGGKIRLHHVDSVDNLALLEALYQMGCRIEYSDRQQWIELTAPRRLKPISIATAPHPGFPTDLQAMMMVAMSQAEGISHIQETIFENRFRHVEALRRMGARIQTKNNLAAIHGKSILKGQKMWATDLRAGAAMVLAGLCAEGDSRIGRVEHIERGYEDIVKDLCSLGACAYWEHVE